MRYLRPVKDYKARHASTMLTFDAVVDALDQIEAKQEARRRAAAKPRPRPARIRGTPLDKEKMKSDFMQLSSELEMDISFQELGWFFSPQFLTRQ